MSRKNKVNKIAQLFITFFTILFMVFVAFFTYKNIKHEKSYKNTSPRELLLKNHTSTKITEEKNKNSFTKFIEKIKNSNHDLPTKIKLKNKNDTIVILDVGHGGEDVGAFYFGIEEKALNLSLARSITEKLQSKKITVLLTRNFDKNLTLAQRVEFINQFYKYKNTNTIAISIHHNSSTYDQANGIETFFYDNFKIKQKKIRPINTKKYSFASNSNNTPELNINEKNYILAESFQKNMCKYSKLRNRGIKRMNLFILKHSRIPTILIECGFLSNYHENKIISEKTFQNKIASASLHAIQNYLKNIKPKKTTSYKHTLND